jgi:hypothetical protein
MAKTTTVPFEFEDLNKGLQISLKRMNEKEGVVVTKLKSGTVAIVPQDDGDYTLSKAHGIVKQKELIDKKPVGMTENSRYFPKGSLNDKVIN